jgi:hypothetical protein
VVLPKIARDAPHRPSSQSAQAIALVRIWPHGAIFEGDCLVVRIEAQAGWTWYFDTAFAAFSAALGQLVRDIFADVARPAFSRVEGDDVRGIVVLSIEQVCYQRRSLGCPRPPRASAWPRGDPKSSSTR